MVQSPPVHDDTAWLEKAEVALRGLFTLARDANELHFAFSLSPEFRGMRGAGWNTAHEAMAAVDDYVAFFKTAPPSRVNARIALGFYSHLAEASGFYEVPKNMLRVVEGLPFSMIPFQHLVRAHHTTGDKIAPNANKVMKDLVGHAATLGLTELSEVFRDAFDPDVRNGYAHADYVVWKDEIRFPHRNGGYPRALRFDEFQKLLNRGLNFFHGIFQIMDEHVRSYDPARTIRAQLGPEPPANWTIHYEPARGTFTISDAPPT